MKKNLIDKLKLYEKFIERTKNSLFSKLKYYTESHENKKGNLLDNAVEIYSLREKLRLLKKSSTKLYNLIPEAKNYKKNI